VIETPDGNVVITGYTFNQSAGNFDMFIRKVSPDLSLNFFDKSIVGPNDETAYDVVPLDNGGYMLVGTSAAPGGSNPSNAALVKVDAVGNKATGFPVTFGGAAYESALSVIKTASGNLLMCGNNSGSNGGDVYVLQTDQNGVAIAGFPINVGGTGAEGGKDVVAVSDGYMIAGSKTLDAYALKINLQGMLIAGQNQSYGANGDDYFNGVSKTNDGGFIFTGGKINTLYLVKTNKDGKQ
jgi:hypothetical protein